MVPIQQLHMRTLVSMPIWLDVIALGERSWPSGYLGCWTPDSRVVGSIPTPGMVRF